MKIIDFIKLIEDITDPTDELNLFFEEFNLKIPITEKDISILEKGEINIIVRD